MGKMIDRLVAELQERKPVCTCGAVAYPRNWMKQTRLKAIEQGAVYACECGEHDTLLCYLKVPPPKAGESQ